MDLLNEINNFKQNISNKDTFNLLKQKIIDKINDNKFNITNLN